MGRGFGPGPFGTETCLKEDAKTIHTAKTIKPLVDSINNPDHNAANKRGLLRLGDEYDETRKN